MRTPRVPHLQILYEDRDLLVVNKSAGLLTSTVPREKRPTLLAQVRDYLAETDRHARPGLIHRLDKDAAGLLIFSKNDQAYQSLKTQFFHHTVQRIYHAVVLGIPSPKDGTIRSHLVETTTGKVHATKIPHKGQLAITHYKTLATSNLPLPLWERVGVRGKSSTNEMRPIPATPTSSPQSKIQNPKSKIPTLSLLRITLETGRKHQIRAHLSQINHPILNDPMYGPTPKQKGLPLMLLATQLSLLHPRTNKQMTWTLPLPRSFTLPK